jgi:predicted  nucleic acid-binding Zn-ribbon protein
MLITFKSKAAADILMYEAHAKRLLDLLGKDVKRGVITAAETGAAVQKLEAEIEAERQREHEAEQDARRQAQAQGQNEEEIEHVRESHAAQSVSFAARAYPLLEMLRAAHAAGRDVMWGV